MFSVFAQGSLVNTCPVLSVILAELAMDWIEILCFKDARI